MSTVKVSSPDSPNTSVDEQMRRHRDQTMLRDLLAEGAASKPTGSIDSGYFDVLRRDVRRRARE